MTGRTAGGWHATADTVAGAAFVPEGLDPFTTGMLLLRHGNVVEAIPALQQATREQPQEPLVWFYLGKASFMDNMLRESERALLEALRLEERLAEAWLQLSEIYVEEGRLPEALEALGNLGRVRGRGPMLAYQEGFVLSKMGRFQEAESMLRTSLNLKPDNPDAWYILGTNFQRAGNDEAAMAAFSRTLQLDPGYADAWLNLGNALARQGRLEEAQDALGRFAAVNEERERLTAFKGNLIVLQRGAQMDLLRGRLDRVETQVAEAEEALPGLPWTYRIRGELLLARGHRAEALEKLRQAAALNPVHADEHLALADAFRQSGDEEAADRHESLARSILVSGGGGQP
jgi:tetratricopeptide (TPR) repeat protein